MVNNRFIATVEETRRRDWFIFFTAPIVGVLVLLLSVKYIFRSEVGKEEISFFLSMVILSLIILRATALGRNIAAIEKIIAEDLEEGILKNKHYVSWKACKDKYKHIEKIPALLLLLGSVIQMNYAIPLFRELSILLIIAQIYFIGVFRLIPFKKYVKGPLTLYFLHSYNENDIAKHMLIYGYKRILIITLALGGLYYLLFHYLIFPDKVIVNTLFYVLCYCVVTALGISLVIASKGFYNILVFVDSQRSKIGLLRDDSNI